MPTNAFDQASRYGVQPDPIGYFHWLIPGLDQALGFQGWLDTRTLPFPGMTDRTCDTVADLAKHPLDTVRWALVNEFQAVPEADILDRLLDYLASLRLELRHGPHRRGKYQVVAVVVNLTGPAQPDTLEMGLPGRDTPNVRFQVAVRTIRDEDAALTLDEIAAGATSRCLLSWISLMRGGGDPSIIERWKAIAGGEPVSALRATYGALVTVFAELTGCVERWKSGLEGWNMRESTVVAEWMAEGRTEGRAEGIAQGKRDALLLMLEQKFGTPVPADLVLAIEAQADPDVLSQWITHAIAAAAMETFRTSIAP